MKSTAVQIPSAQRCFLYFYSARSIGRYAESPCGNSSPISAKAVLFPERFTLRIAPVDRKAHLAEPLSPQFVQQLADQRRAKAAGLPLFFVIKKPM